MSHDFTATSADQERHIGHYQLLKTLGQGSYGKVSLGLHNPTETAVAVKAIRIQQGHSSLQRRLPQEANCMAALHHPHIVQLFEVIVTKNMVYLIMEHMNGGNLRDYLLIHGMLSENEARGIFRQLVLAVHHCHERGVVHRDLKPSNVLLDADRTVKLTDFGLSAFFNKMKLRAFCGNPSYAAPEMFLAEEYDGPPVDVWSLGVLLYRMVTGHVPFDKGDLMELKKAVLRGKYTMPFYLSSQLQYLLTQLLNLNPKERRGLEHFMPSLWLHMNGEEELKPSNEAPPSEGLDPWVTQEMVNMGFKLDQIEHALNNKTYDDIMGTYLLLSKKKPKVQYRTIRVKPFASPDLNTSQGPQEVQPECSRLQQAGQKAMESAGPAASPTSRTATPEPRPESTSATPGPSMESRIPTSGPSGKSRTPTLGPIMESRTPTPGPSLKSRTTTPGPSVESRTTTTGPSMTSRKASPALSMKSRKTSPAPTMTSRKASPALSMTSRKISPAPTMTSRKASPTLSMKSRKASLTPSPKWRKVSPRHSPKSRTATPRSSPKSRAITSLTARPKRKTATPPPSQESNGRTTTPQPSPEPESASSIPPFISELKLGTATPEAESRSTNPPLIAECESRTATSLPSPELTTTPTPAPQCGPGVSPSSHSSSSSRNQEQTSQGRRGLARRCWDFFKKLCLRPCKKGRGKRSKVMPC